MNSKSSLDQMKVNDKQQSVSPWDMRYSKDIPHYFSLQLSRVGLLLGLISFALGLFANQDLKNNLFVVAGILIVISIVAYWIIWLMRERRHGR